MSFDQIGLTDSIDADGDGSSLAVMDVFAQDDDMLDNISMLETHNNIRADIGSRLDSREVKIIRKRYGLSGQWPTTQCEVVAVCGIRRRYVSIAINVNDTRKALQRKGLFGYRKFLVAS